MSRLFNVPNKLIRGLSGKKTDSSTSTCASMREELGSHGYQWLCACAIYPGLRWPLTLALGDALAAAMERPSPDEEETLALARLEWFRTGALPEDLRPALVDDLEPACAQAARATVARFLLSMSLAEDGDEADEMFAQPKLPGWRNAVSAFFGKLPEEARENDPICVEFMLGGSSTPALQRLDRAAAHLTSASVWRMASLRNLLVGGLATAALSAAIWVSLAPDESIAIPRSATLAFVAGAAFSECPDCPKMVMLPAGQFLMGSRASEEDGSDAEGPQREVIVYAFAMSRTEVTFDQWQACVAGGGCTSNREPEDEGWGRGSRPVINVSWNDAQEYVDWLNGQVAGAPYRLPSEAEWEYAARAGTDTPYWTGATISREQANFNSEQTLPVGSLNSPNPFGLHDVSGNVWEWVEDCWHENYACSPKTSEPWLSEQRDGAAFSQGATDITTEGSCSQRVLRGGSWLSSPRSLRSANRNGYVPGYRVNYVGFRLARTLTPGFFTSLPGVQGAEPPAENFWPSLRYEGACLDPNFEPGDASNVFLSLGKGNRMRIRGGPAFFDSCEAMPSKRRHDRPAALAAQAYCKALGFEGVADYEANECEEDESAYAVFDETDQCWKLKNTGSKNGCYAVISSVTCSRESGYFGGSGFSGGGGF